MTPTLMPNPNCADAAEPGLITAIAARTAILNACQPVTGYGCVPLLDALDRVLDSDVIAPFPVPGHCNAAVDGYALCAADWLGVSLEIPVIGTALAGQPFVGSVQRGQALRITTGAVLPEGADTVVMLEHVQTLNDTIRLTNPPRLGENVRLAGEDLTQGSIVLNAGRRLNPADIGLLASLGLAEVAVRRRLRVALFSTGDEVLAPGQPWQPGRIYDSNRHSLLAALKRLGVQTRDLGIVPDSPSALAAVLATAAEDADVILSSGGVSVGTADYTKDVLASLGQVDFCKRDNIPAEGCYPSTTVVFWKVAIKPGRPLVFGRLGDALFFGLPGNPVAVLVTYYQFVLPALYRRMGLTQPPEPLTMPARSSVALAKKPGRSEYLRGVLSRNDVGEYCVATTGQQGSGILRSMSLADCFIVLSHDSGPVAAGDWVTVQPFAGFG